MVGEFVAGLATGGILGLTIGSDGRFLPIEYGKALQAVREAKPEFAKPVDIDTTIARDEPVQYQYNGTLLFVKNPSTPSKPVYIRFNHADAPELELTKFRYIKSPLPFADFWIRNEAGTGTLELVVCKGYQLDVAPGEVDTAIQHSTIAVPVDVQMAYIMMPVDIQAQLANINIDIVAQSVTLDINIKSITGGVTFNIGSISGTVNIAIASAQSVGVWIQAEWASKQGTQKNFVGYSASEPTGDSVLVEYWVTTGKTLYITSFGGACRAVDAANRNNNQICTGQLIVQSATLARHGGNGGFHCSFDTPLVATAGQKLELLLYNYANHDCAIAVCAVGYEI